MEGGDQPTSRNGAANGGARWNPTNEQITYLEDKYRQGLKTPTAEEIQKITEDLKVHGKIEGKNVFYWFQNHKARQRQKQKQQQQHMFGYYNRVRHHHPMKNPPLLLPAPLHHQNVIYNSSLPFYLAPPVKRDHSCLYPKVQLPAAPSGGGEPCKKTRPIDQYQQKKLQKPTPQRYNTSMQEPTCKNPHVATLDLFPIHPTGILQPENIARENNDGNNDKGSSSKNPNCLSGDWFDHNIGNIECTAREGHVAAIDFFACGHN